MLLRNNIDIDYDLLEQEIARQKASCQALSELTEQLASIRPSSVSAHRVESLEALFALNDRDFLTAAFRLFTGTKTDDSSFNRYLVQLRNGVPKNYIAASLRYSPAGRRHPQKLTTPASWRLYALVQVPILGRLVETSIAILGAANIKRSLVVNERRSAEIQQRQEVMLEQMERDIRDINEKMDASHAVILSRIEKIQKTLLTQGQMKKR